MSRKLSFCIAMVGIILILGLALVLGCGKKEQEAVVNPTKIEFVTSYDAAIKLAQEKDQKILIDFYTDWCTWCKRLDTTTYIDSSVIAMSKDIIFAKINAEVDTLTARKYLVRGYPTIVMIDKDGAEIDRLVGYLPGPEFKETFDNYSKDINTLNYFLRKLDSGASNEIYSRLGEKYSDRGLYSEAEPYYSKIMEADPDNKDGFTIDAIMALADMRRRDKKYDEALDLFNKVKEKFPQSEKTLDADMWIALVYKTKGDTAKAIAGFEQFIKNHPQSEDTAYAQEQIQKLKNPPPPEEKK
jgi:thioredoxin-like negative regulator of GroEL